MSVININDIKIGMTESYSQTITDSDIKAFAGISGDRNPIHVDEEYAQNSRYKKRIAHGMISSSFFSALFGTKLPGEGCVYVSQSLNFKRPVYMGDTVTATIIVKSIDIDKKRVFLDKLALGSRIYFIIRYSLMIFKLSLKAQRGQYAYDETLELGQRFFRIIEDVGARVHIEGIDNIKKVKDEPVVFVGNHMSTLETMLFPAVICPIKKSIFVVKKSLLTSKSF
jgi:3-hydroxybutyryl-CoA dehydratase